MNNIIIMESLDDINIHDAVELWYNNTEDAILKYGHINNWDVSNVTNMNNLFFNMTNFNDCINNWNVSNVISMKLMFYNATSFNQNITNWNVSNVIEPSSRLAKARRDKSRYLYINIFNDV